MFLSGTAAALIAAHHSRETGTLGVHLRNQHFQLGEFVGVIVHLVRHFGLPLIHLLVDVLHLLQKSVIQSGRGGVFGAGLFNENALCCAGSGRIAVRHLLDGGHQAVAGGAVFLALGKRILDLVRVLFQCLAERVFIQRKGGQAVLIAGFDADGAEEGAVGAAGGHCGAQGAVQGGEVPVHKQDAGFAFSS